MTEALVKLRQHLLSGVSFAIPFIACGGIMIALAIGLNSHYSPNAPGNFDHSPHALKLLIDIGGTAFTLMPAVLAGYIAYSVAGKPALVSGMVGGWLATHLGTTLVNGVTKDVSAGFLGAMVAGLAAGYLVAWIKRLKVPKVIRPIMPILIIPIVSATLIGVLMLEVIGIPIASAMTALGSWLAALGTGNAILLATVLGAMIAFDMGGPVNKVAFFFGSAMIEQGNFAVMGCIAAAICTPPLGLGLATVLARSRWTTEEREAGAAALAMGMIGITEGAIPFAASDPLRVIPTIVIGSATAAIVAMLGHVADHAPHGGPIVIPVVDQKLMFIVAILAGTLVTALLMNLVKMMTTRPVIADETPAV